MSLAPWVNRRQIDVFYPGKWLVGGAESHALHLARSLQRFGDVRLLVTEPVSQLVLRQLLRIDGGDIQIVKLLSGSERELRVRCRGSAAFFNCSSWSLVTPPCRPAAMLVYYPPHIQRSSALRRTLKRAVQTVRSTTTAADPGRAMTAYDAILTNSRWTGKLVETRWNRAWQVLYPAVTPVAERPIAPVEKSKLILTVGRIGAGGTDKGHELLARCFRGLNQSNWRFVVAGALNYDDALASVERLHSIAGPQAEVVVNPSADELISLYRTAAIYWHAAGFGTAGDSVRNEHFGISLVEAMSGSCAPLAYRGGGPIEILDGTLTSCLWSTEEELISKTEDIINGEMGDVGLKSYARSIAFDVAQFDARVAEVVTTIMSLCP